MGERPLEERANGGRCKLCGKQRPPGRPVYCSDKCSAIGRSEIEQRRQQKRRVACQRCGGEKPAGPRGSRYCDECRLVIADSSAQIEYERSRRRRLAEIASTTKPIRRRTIDAPEGHKWCARCQAFRPHKAFPPRSDGGFAPYCRPCQRTYNQERRIRLQFGLTWDEYEQLLADQNFACAICGGKPRKNMLAVDHDHTTGEIRGLLCGRCNHRLLGSANDDPARLRKAADYLEAFEPRETFGEPRFVPGFQDGEAEAAS